MRSRTFLMTGFVMALATSGCVVVSGGGGTVVADPYQPCGTGEVCAGGTACASANRTTSGWVGTFCTADCDTTNPVCPADPLGTPVVCVPDSAATTLGQCYLACTTAGCPYGQTCATEAAGGVAYCVPD